MVVQRLPGALEQQGVTDLERRLADELLLAAMNGEDDEVAALRDHARKGGLADEPERGGITTSATPVRRVSSPSGPTSRP